MPNSQTESTESKAAIEPEISNYMLRDPQFVGYPSSEIQETIYEAVITDIKVGATILDVGCGRGDFGYYATMQPRLYIGFDQNDLMIKIGNKKYPDLDISTHQLKEYSSNPDNIKHQYNNIVSILALDVDYGGLSDPSKYLIDHINQLLLLNGDLYTIIIPNTNNDIQLQYNLGDLISYLNTEQLNKGIKYAIDASFDVEIVKILIIKNLS